MDDQKLLANTNNGDSESEDEDFVPEPDDDLPLTSVDSAVDAGNPTIPKLPTAKQQAVDDAFTELFGKPFVPKAREKKKRPKSKKSMKKKKILSEIFGGSGIASKVIANAALVAKSTVESGRRKGPLKKAGKLEIKEKMKFAGQTIEVTRNVVSGNEDSEPKQKPAGIDAVLSKINGPQKITTIDKTSVDWSNFKDKSGLEEELKKKAEGKDAYLVKKDFLNRVDLRRFEQERDERNKKRAANAASSK